VKKKKEPAGKKVAAAKKEQPVARKKVSATSLDPNIYSDVFEINRVRGDGLKSIISNSNLSSTLKDEMCHFINKDTGSTRSFLRRLIAKRHGVSSEETPPLSKAVKRTAMKRPRFL